MAIVSAGRHRIDLHSSNAFDVPTLYVDYRGCPPTKHSSHVSFYGQASERETLNVNARIWMMTRKKRSPSLILSLNQSQSQNLNQTTRTR